MLGHYRRVAHILFQGFGQPDRHGPKQQSGRSHRLSRLQPAQARLRGQRGGRGDEYRGQHLFGAGRGRNGQDALGTLREGVAETTEHDDKPQRQIHLDQYAAGQPDSGLEDLDAHARYVRRGCGRQLRRAYRAKDLPCGNSGR